MRDNTKKRRVEFSLNDDINRGNREKKKIKTFDHFPFALSSLLCAYHQVFNGIVESTMCLLTPIFPWISLQKYFIVHTNGMNNVTIYSSDGG